MIELPNEVFRNRKQAEKVADEQVHYTPIDSIVVEKGVWVWLEGAEYPQNGLVTPEMMAGMNVAKRLLVQVIKVAVKPVLIPAYIFIWFLPFKMKLKFLDAVLEMYTEVAYKAISDFVMSEDHQTDFSKELEWLVYKFLKTLGINEQRASRCSEVISTLIQGDTAYRYRVMDIFNEINKDDLLKSPAKEINRVLQLFVEREKDKNVIGKFKRLGLVITILLAHPKIKNIFRETIRTVSITNLKYNEVDMYWALLHKDYKYLGKTYEERKLLLGDAGVPNLIHK